MPTNKSLDSFREQLAMIEGKLKAMELQEPSTQIEGLQKSYAELAGKMSEIKGSINVVGIVFGVIAFIFTVLGIIGGHNIIKFQKYEAARTNASDILVVLFQDKIADAIDRVSFFDPIDKQQSRKIEEVTEMQKQLTDFGVTSVRFQVRSELAETIKLVVGDKREEALSKLRGLSKKTEATDPFVFARASTLEAILNVRANYPKCNSTTKKLLEDAINKDSEVAAAFNILGVCLTNEAQGLLASKSEEEWLKGSETMQRAIGYYDLSFSLNPTSWALSKFLNNKVWGNAVFLEAALNKDYVIKRYLNSSGYSDMDHFLTESLKHLSLCKLLVPNEGIWWETEAELWGLQYLYFKNRNDESGKAQALKNQREQFKYAIVEKCLFCLRNKDEALSHFTSDTLLRNLHADKEIIELLSINTKVSGRSQ